MKVCFNSSLINLYSKFQNISTNVAHKSLDMCIFGNHFYILCTKVTLVTLTLDLVNQKSIGFLSSPRPISVRNMKAL